MSTRPGWLSLLPLLLPCEPEEPELEEPLLRIWSTMLGLSEPVRAFWPSDCAFVASFSAWRLLLFELPELPLWPLLPEVEPVPWADSGREKPQGPSACTIWSFELCDRAERPDEVEVSSLSADDDDEWWARRAWVW